MKALRFGIYAAYAAGDRLAKGDDAGMRRYRAFVDASSRATCAPAPATTPTSAAGPNPSSGAAAIRPLGWRQRRGRISKNCGGHADDAEGAEDAEDCTELSASSAFPASSA